MLFQYLLPSLLAVTAAAFPVADVAESEGELVLFKRDDALDARDLELADVHGVDLTEMYKHSMLKRDDGDHVTIWVARSFEEHHDEAEDEQGVTKRQNARPGRESNYLNDGSPKFCSNHRRQNHTGPNGPFSGGVQAMHRWARDHRGSWPVFNHWENLVIAGSNSGANAVYKARRVSGGTGFSRVGTHDVRNDADWTQNRAREFSGRWRASSKGGETCGPNSRINYEIVTTNLRY